MLCFLNTLAASVIVESPSIVYNFFIISDALIDLGGTSREKPSVTISQSVTIPNGSSSLKIIILPILSDRSEEHTSELQSPCNIVCRLLLEKKKKNKSTFSQYNIN